MRYIRNTILIILCVVMLPIVIVHFLPERWVATQVSRLLTDITGYSVDIDAIGINILSFHPTVKASQIVVNGSQLEGFLSLAHVLITLDIPASLKGTLTVDRIELAEGEVKFLREANGNNTWTGAELLSKDVPSDKSEKIELPTLRSLTVSDVGILVVDEVSGHDVDLDLAADGSVGVTDEQWTAKATGNANGTPVEGILSLAGIQEIVAGSDSLKFNGSLAAGVNNIKLDGGIDDANTLDGLNANISLTLDDWQTLSSVSNIDLPALPATQLATRLTREAPQFLLSNIDMVVGNSSVNGDVRVDLSTTPISVYSNVLAAPLDIDQLMQSLYSSEAVNPVNDEPIEKQSADEADNDSTNEEDTLLPEEQFALQEVFNIVQGAFDIRADEISIENLPFDAFDISVAMDPDQLDVEFKQVELADGAVKGSMIVVQAGKPTSSNVELQAELELSALNVARILRDTDLPNDAGGKLGGKLKYWSKGSSVAELAAELDGGMFLLMAGGFIDSNMVEIAGLDLFQAVGDLITPSDEQTAVRCAYLDLHTKKGLSTINNLIIDTVDTVFLAEGRVDLSNETLDIVVEPHPKDVSLLASRTSVSIGGTMANPDFGVGAALPVRAVAIALLSQLATPALALLPLIEMGGGQPAPYCNALGGALSDGL